MATQTNRDVHEPQQPPSFEAYGGSAPECYERYFVPSIGAPLAGDLVAAAALRPGERVLDVACGTGIVARLAADRVGATGVVSGLDINPGMLAVAVPRRSTGADDRLARGGLADDAPMADGAYDVVLCQMGLQFFPDKPAALCEMHRVLAPGGRVFLNVPGPEPELFTILAEALAHHIEPELAPFVRQVFSLAEAREASGLAGRTRGSAKPTPVPTTRSFDVARSRPHSSGSTYDRHASLAAAVAAVDRRRTSRARARHRRKVGAIRAPWSAHAGPSCPDRGRAGRLRSNAPTLEMPAAP